MAGLGDRPESVDGLGHHHREIDGLDVRRPLRRVEPGEPEQVLEHPPHPLRLVVDPVERRAVPADVAVLGEGEAGVGLDDRQRRSQLMRGVGGEVELALARGLDRRADPAADRDGTEEDESEQERGDHELGEDDRPARLADGLERLADDDVVVADRPAGESHLDPADRGRRRLGHRGVGGRQDGVRGLRLDMAVRVDLPQEQRSPAEAVGRRRLVGPLRRGPADGAAGRTRR